MLLIKLWNYLSGYVIIKIVGEYGERLLNQAAMKNLYLWDVKRINDNELTAKINVRNFFKLARLAKKSRSRIYVLQRVGLFFTISKLKKRKAFLFGALLFVVAIYLMSSFIWNIEIKCSDNDLSTSIIQDLREWGLREGTFKYGLDKQYYLNKLLTKYKNISWAEIEIRGSKLIVELVKKQLPPELEENTPCDIIASKDGIIEEIINFRGEALVEPGQTVSKGDVLITGKIVLDQEQDQVLLVHAKGIVNARVWYQKAVKVPLVKTKMIPTGNSKKSLVLQLGKHILNFQLGDIAYDYYNKKTINEFSILPRLSGGIQFDIIEYAEVKPIKEFLNIEEASREAEAELFLQLKDILKEKKVTQKKMEYMLDSDQTSVIGSMIIEVIEDIGQKREIKYGEEKI
ncbi:Sporulation protein YqfD [Tepidanaerobacter acetatoxydans Re1]|uniref:Sporulation protein YqfD n=1 Tax=Tepidanaerobacter acetatoxydans (strain DSM 21804 / JCM 16047 / Re1) TaxID=1209989 RepID=F4LSY6_TEPAE|nr:sporulation protein YqfD [Tepidanaerobacter acetatoxydans]AEE91255.1 sporulation protein YqfD [Tepidanaerobacter acetatoxydans Re1]CDI40606.1 Sporulation protein YqfD [Tepidanaerobacter acetatoxydans Re1]